MEGRGRGGCPPTPPHPQQRLLELLGLLLLALEVLPVVSHGKAKGHAWGGPGLHAKGRGLSRGRGERAGLGRRRPARPAGAPLRGARL